MSTDGIKAKIAALRAKTRASGCTEAEAVAAAELAAKLMQQHGLSEAEVTMTEASAPEKTKRATWRSKLSGWIAYATNTASIMRYDADGEAFVTYIGLAPGPEIAVYLRDVCFRAVDAEIRIFKTGKFYRQRRSLRTKRTAVADFVKHLVEHLGRRVVSLFASSLNREARLAAIALRDRRFPDAVDHAAPEKDTQYLAAAIAGRNAANGVALNRGVATPKPRQLSAPPKQLGLFGSTGR